MTAGIERPPVLDGLDIQEAIQLLIQAKQSIVETRYVIAALLALQLYEWFVGLEDEVRLVHRARWTLIKVLYGLCRYYPLLLWIILIWAYVPDHTREVCDKVVVPVNALLAPCQIFAQGERPIRCYVSPVPEAPILSLTLPVHSVPSRYAYARIRFLGTEDPRSHSFRHLLYQSCGH
jgi:hypothetical protein